MPGPGLPINFPIGRSDKDSRLAEKGSITKAILTALMLSLVHIGVSAQETATSASMAAAATFTIEVEKEGIPSSQMSCRPM